MGSSRPFLSCQTDTNLSLRTKKQQQIRSEYLFMCCLHLVKSQFYSVLAKILVSLCSHKCTAMKRRGREQPRSQQSDEFHPADSYKEANATVQFQFRLLPLPWLWLAKDSREPLAAVSSLCSFCSCISRVFSGAVPYASRNVFCHLHRLCETGDKSTAQSTLRVSTLQNIVWQPETYHAPSCYKLI